VSAALLSALVCPGAGQWRNGQRLKGAALVVLSVGLVVLLAVRIVWVSITAVPLDLDVTDLAGTWALAHGIVLSHIGEFNGLVLAIAAVWVYGVVDAILVGRSRVPADPQAPRR
jgi:hypothetical protein